MKKNRKALALLLCVAMSITALVGCGGKENNNETIEIGSSIDALDALYADKTLENGTISDLNIVYKKNDDKLFPVWAAKLNGNNKIITRWFINELEIY